MDLCRYSNSLIAELRARFIFKHLIYILYASRFVASTDSYEGRDIEEGRHSEERGYEAVSAKISSYDDG